MPGSDLPIESPELDFSRVWHKVEEIGRGGGAIVYRCISQQLIRRITAFSLQSNVAVLPEETRHSNCASFIDEINSRLILMGDGIAAVKVPLRQSDTELSRFQREVKAMKVCKHPAFIKLLGHGPLDRISWLAMEYHPNGNLGNHVAEFKGRALECLLAMRPIVESTALLHQQGFVHRDIKPKNIFISAKRSLILGDLGIVFPSTDTERLTEAGSVLISRDWVPDWGRFTEDPTSPPS